MDYCFIPSSYIYVTLYKITLFLDKNNKQTHYYFTYKSNKRNEKFTDSTN